MIELALPAGSLQAALHAFDGGADAVYLGLQEYSARKYATNFSFGELARLKQEAMRLGKAVYVTLNTLLDDQELEGILPTLRRLELVRPDGIIVQDLGLASLLCKEFPSLPVHASTQIAVHTAEGVREMQRLGFSRIVLSRELTFAQIAAIRQACPDADLKVFIHGAMCYGFSGLCMASHYLTGRSANRGECAQICRTWFTTEGTEESRSGYFFSMTDLAAAEDIIRLRDIGINALKIEGRMKSPAYVRFAAQYYRMILDGETEPTALRNAREALDTQFARSSSGGWTFSYGKEVPAGMRHTPSLGTVDFPGHRGTNIGVVQGCRLLADSTELKVSLVRDISVRDGLMLLGSDEKDLATPLRFPLQSIRLADGRSSFHAPAGSTAFIEVPGRTSVAPSTPIHRVSRHDLHVGEMADKGLQPFRFPMDLGIELHADHLAITPSELPSWMGDTLRKTYPIDIQQAKSPQQVGQNLLKIFSSPGEGWFTARSVKLENRSAWNDGELFLPLSRLKEIRRSWYEYLGSACERAIMTPRPPAHGTSGSVHPLPMRHLLNPKIDDHLPWADPVSVQRRLAANMAAEDVLAVIDDKLYLPLAPVTFDEKAAMKALDEIIAACGGRVRIGLNNVAHLGWARKHPGIEVFADVYLYMSNREAAALVLHTMPTLVGMYRWIEREEGGTAGWMMKPSAIGPAFKLPLFISRNCFRYDAMGLPCEGCPRHGTWHVNQTGKRYRVDVRECVTIVSEEPEHQ